MPDMIEKACKDCRFWDSGSAVMDGDFENIRVCSKPKMFWDATEWQREESNELARRVVLPEHQNTMMFVQDGSDYHAELLTRADFYCAHFSLKDTDKALET